MHEVKNLNKILIIDCKESINRSVKNNNNKMFVAKIWKIIFGEKKPSEISCLKKYISGSKNELLMLWNNKSVHFTQILKNFSCFIEE